MHSSNLALHMQFHSCYSMLQGGHVVPQGCMADCSAIWERRRGISKGQSLAVSSQSGTRL